MHYNPLNAINGSHLATEMRHVRFSKTHAISLKSSASISFREINRFRLVNSAINNVCFGITQALQYFFTIVGCEFFCCLLHGALLWPIESISLLDKWPHDSWLLRSEFRWAWLYDTNLIQFVVSGGPQSCLDVPWWPQKSISLGTYNQVRFKVFVCINMFLTYPNNNVSRNLTLLFRTIICNLEFPFMGQHLSSRFFYC